MLLFGGWQNYAVGDWLGLQVGLITGPEYAIYSIEPLVGPITGKTKCLVKGEGFKQGVSY